MDDIDFSEYGSCPNCNSQNLHVSQLGYENGKTCCIYCYKEERSKSLLYNVNGQLPPHICKYCGVETTQTDEECYKAPK